MGRFGVGERVRYAVDWPDLDDPPVSVPKGTCATVIQAPVGPREMYLVVLDQALPGWLPEMNVGVDYLEPE